MERGLRVLSWVAAVLYVGVGVLELLFASDSFAHRAVFATVLCLLAAAVVVGAVRLIAHRPWAGAAIATVGAIAGGVALFWTIAAIVLALAIAILSVLVARQAVARPSVQPA